MTYLEPGHSHIYQHQGVQDCGWEVGPGWILDEVLSCTCYADGRYELICKVTAEENFTDDLAWPPLVEGLVVESEPA